MKKIYLVVTESDKFSISYATADQFKAQNMCHRLTKVSGMQHSVKTEKWLDLPFSLRIELKQKFSVNI